MLNQIDLSRLDLNLLVVFEAVLEERNIARAATRLHLSASAVSHGLRRLRQTFNDPLFLKHPKGVVPTAQAIAMAPAVAQILAQVRQVIANAEVFEPARSRRRLVIGAPDALAVAILPRALKEIERNAPGLRIGVQNVQPSETLEALDARRIDVALYPLEELPPRFESRELFEEEFVVAARAGHKLFRRLTLENYCKARHVLVSSTNDPHGFVDDVLKTLGAARTVALTVPTFLLALAVIADSDMVGTLPRSLLALHAKSFAINARRPPFPLSSSTIRAIAPRPAMQDGAIVWLMDLLHRLAASPQRTHR
jgi:DNA-binding transcriptional LysR family regulator